LDAEEEAYVSETLEDVDEYIATASSGWHRLPAGAHRREREGHPGIGQR